ncbi:hypothetical protein PENTCL1PPCAC_12537, partial [Pristionchus entomophagus]
QQTLLPDDPVYLGFAAPYDTDDLYRLSSCFLPLGKVGGKPSWLNPVAIPKSEELACKSCTKPLCFLLQVYATADSDSAHSFHRTIFLFVCRNPACSKANDPSNLVAFRCCLPRVNAWYGADGPLDADLVMEDELPCAPAGSPALCRICGCFASKKCAKCGEAWYCSKEHQALDWKLGHRSNCGQPEKKREEGEERKNPENPWLFEEMGMEMDRENLPSSIFEDLSDDEEDEEREGEKEEKRRMDEYVKMVKAKKLDEGAAAQMAEDDLEVEEKKDVCFDRFNRVMQLQSEQILRYQRGGRPLIPSDKAPPINQVPACSLCGASRQFELQLTPHLLSLIGVDSITESIDWASVYVYTCSANCVVPESGYASEAVVKHDFVE